MIGCRHPNLDPTALSAKNALLPAELCSVVREMAEEETERRTLDGALPVLLTLSRFLDTISVKILPESSNGGIHQRPR